MGLGFSNINTHIVYTYIYAHKTVYMKQFGLQPLNCEVDSLGKLSRYYIHYHDKDNTFLYCDNSKFLDTTVHYTKHTGVLVYRAIFEW